jgi:hypothetical protein
LNDTTALGFQLLDFPPYMNIWTSADSALTQSRRRRADNVSYYFGGNKGIAAGSILSYSRYTLLITLRLQITNGKIYNP